MPIAVIRESAYEVLVGELRRYLITGFRMAPDVIVEHPDISEHELPGLLTSVETIASQTPPFSMFRSNFSSGYGSPGRYA